jgi:hypothetical protein
MRLHGSGPCSVLYSGGVQVTDRNMLNCSNILVNKLLSILMTYMHTR